ncbi:MAG: glycosyltransferase [Thermodesulfobacteriota bacterium]
MGHPLRITILTIGSRGDVQPYVALGMGLKAAGHHIRLATHACFEPMIRDSGLDFFLISGDPRGTLEGEAGQKWLEANKNPFTFMKRMIDAAKPVMWQILDDYWRAAENSDLILFPALAALPAASIAEKLKIPAFPAYLQHVHPTRSYPSAIALPLPSLGGIYNQLTYSVGGQLFWQFMRSLINRWRMDSLNLPPYPVKDPLNEWLKKRAPCFYGFSPSVVPRPPEWGDEIHITGYWFLEAPTDWQPPAPLVDFLKSGPAPVFVGFGSMTGRNPEEVTTMILKALAQTQQRGLLLTGWGGLGDTDLPDYVYKIDWAPFGWLFLQVAAVVHHGGAGTTGAGLRAGVPNIIVPFFGDQHFWGWRVEELGAGPKPIPHRKLSAERLASAIQDSIVNKKMQSRAAKLGQQIRSEEGVANAIQAIGRYL